MERLESYRELCKEIELWEIRLEDLETERNVLIKKMSPSPQVKLCANYSGMPGGGAAVIDFPKTWREAVHLNDRIEEARDILSLKREAKRKMEKVIGEFDKLEYKVALLRDIERKPLKEIADNLGYSYDWIRKVSQRVKRLRVTS